MNLPSSHGGGVLPGNQRGLSGSAAAALTEIDRVPAGAKYFLNFSFFPPRKEAFVDPTMHPFLWELHAINILLRNPNKKQTANNTSTQYQNTNFYMKNPMKKNHESRQWRKFSLRILLLCTNYECTCSSLDRNKSYPHFNKLFQSTSRTSSILLV